MKKLSLIAGLACLATVGGVFGAWTFGSETNEATKNEELAAITVDTDVITLGGITADVTDSLAISYAQNGTGTGAAATISGSFTVTCGHATVGKSYTYAASNIYALVTAIDGEKDSLLDYEVADTQIALTMSQNVNVFTLNYTSLDTALDVASIGTVGNHDQNLTMVNNFAAAAANTKITIYATFAATEA